MLVKNATIYQMNLALTELNKKYDDNVIWNRAPEYNGGQLQFTLRVKSSKGKGARISKHGEMFGKPPRRSVSACWHVHGDFFDILLYIEPEAIIKSSANTGAIVIYKDSTGVVVGNWQDWNIGSSMYPIMYSESCLCDA